MGHQGSIELEPDEGMGAPKSEKSRRASRRPDPGRRRLRTVDVARAAGAHVNTVRLYETWGFLPKVPRAANGWRAYSQAHLDQMVFARSALHGQWPGRRIRESALELVRCAARGDPAEARERARAHLQLVRDERRRAVQAAGDLQRWARGVRSRSRSAPLSIRAAADAVEATIDQLYNWERNGLLRVPRDPLTGYRAYGPSDLGRLRVIRTLLRAGYSVAAIYRMSRSLDRGVTEGLRELLDTPREGESVFTAFDSWLTALEGQEKRARQMIRMLEARG